SDGAKEFIRKCCTYRKDLRPDVLLLCNDYYLKPKAQLKRNLDTNSLPGPVDIPPSILPAYSNSGNIAGLPQSSHIQPSHQQAPTFPPSQQAHAPCPSLQPLTLPPSN
ncbi:unnamed protein product, partial [Calicophoron daubneyi]